MLVAIIQFVLQGVLYGFLSLVFQILIVLYCLGPQNFWADAFACINAMVHGESQEIKEKSALAFGLTGKKFSHQRLLEKIFIASNTRVFAVIFWYSLLGPLGAMLYRMTSLAAPQLSQQQTHPEILFPAKISIKVLDWVPVRLLTFLFALGGHFVQVLTLWRDNVLTSYTHNEWLLTKCGLAALGREELNSTKEAGAQEQSAVALIDRVFIIVLAIIALITLIC